MHVIYIILNLLLMISTELGPNPSLDSNLREYRIFALKRIKSENVPIIRVRSRSISVKEVKPGAIDPPSRSTVRVCVEVPEQPCITSTLALTVPSVLVFLFCRTSQTSDSYDCNDSNIQHWQWCGNSLVSVSVTDLTHRCRRS